MLCKGQKNIVAALIYCHCMTIDPPIIRNQFAPPILIFRCETRNWCGLLDYLWARLHPRKIRDSFFHSTLLFLYELSIFLIYRYFISVHQLLQYLLQVLPSVKANSDWHSSGRLVSYICLSVVILRDSNFKELVGSCLHFRSSSSTWLSFPLSLWCEIYSCSL